VGLPLKTTPVGVDSVPAGGHSERNGDGASTINLNEGASACVERGGAGLLFATHQGLVELRVSPQGFLRLGQEGLEL